MTLRAVFSLAGWIALTACFAALGAAGSATAQAFYAQLDKPSWAPPAWLFGPAWTILSLLMAIAATIVAFQRRDHIAAALLLPYIGWVSFATALCFSIWQRNPGML